MRGKRQERWLGSLGGEVKGEERWWWLGEGSIKKKGSEARKVEKSGREGQKVKGEVF